MRIWLAASGMVLAGAASVAAMEPNQSRPGGGYLKAPAASPDACARACEDDSLCMAWTYTAPASAPPTPQSCELKAVIPPARVSQGSFSGLSSRAPRLMRLIHPATPQPAPAPIAEITPPAGLRGAGPTLDQAAPLTAAGPPLLAAAETQEPPKPTPAARPNSAGLADIASKRPAPVNALSSPARLPGLDDDAPPAADGPQPLYSVQLGARAQPPVPAGGTVQTPALDKPEAAPSQPRRDRAAVLRMGR
jgi:hypothetical protein